MNIDLGSLSQDDLIALKAKLDGLTDVSGRSPMRPRQLHDLTLLPTATDPRPTFFWSADTLRGVDTRRTTPFPMLLWHGQTGVEVTVTDAKMQSAYVANGYVSAPPFDIVIDPMDVLAAQLDALSESDRAALIESQRQDRLNAIRKKLADMPEDKLAILLAQSEAKGGANRESGRGRRTA